MTRWIAFFLVFGSLATFTNAVNAMFAKLSEAELISTSDAIVIGELIGTTPVQLANGGVRLNLGVIKIDSVLKGDPNSRVVMVSLPYPDGPRAGSDVFYKPGQRGLWFLRLRGQGEQGVFVADHPQRFVPLEQKTQIDAIKRLLRK